MKGLTHFVSGIAAATFIPQVVEMSANRTDVSTGAASSFILLLAGAYGLLPDTMDFKMGQFFSVADYEVDPDPRNPDPQAMCETFAKAVNETGDTGKPNRIQFFTTQLGANQWRNYNIIFDRKEVMIQFNEIVSTSQIPIPGSAPKVRVGRAPLKYELLAKTEKVDTLNKIVRWLRQKIKGPDKPAGPVKPSTVDIFGGTQFGFELESPGKIYFNWLPWHRTWSHSWVFGFILTLPIHAIAYGFHLPNWWLYGLVAFLGFFVHVAEDMTGHIGGSLFWPLIKTRCEGLELFKASDPRTNFSVIYTACFLVFFNLGRSNPKIIDPALTVAKKAILYGEIIVLGWLIPMALYFLAVAGIKNYIKAAEAKVEVHEEADGEDKGSE